MKITVLGGGNGSIAAAADFSLAGHDVTLWRRGAADVAEHHKLNDTIVVRDEHGTREIKIGRITDDIAAAMAGAELIVSPVPAHAHEEMAPVIAPYFEPGQVLFLPPGTLGTVIYAKACKAAGTFDGVAFAETGTLPWLVRKHGFAEIVVSTRAVRLPTGVMPVADGDRARAVIDRAFPGVIEDCGDVISAALMNAGPIIHPPLIIMNAGPLEHFEAWDIHNEGTQASIRRTTDTLDAERIAVREAYGYGAPHFPLADHYRDGEMWMYDGKSRAKLKDSNDWREKIILTEHRYMLEDTRMGLSLLVSLADAAGVDVPVARSLMSLASAIVQEDFMQTGRPVSKLGLTGTSEELKAQVAK
jgi:opine dehydrogenase